MSHHIRVRIVNLIEITYLSEAIKYYDSFKFVTSIFCK